MKKWEIMVHNTVNYGHPKKSKRDENKVDDIKKSKREVLLDLYHDLVDALFDHR